MKYIRTVISFYNNCVEIPKKDFVNKFPRFSSMFYFLYGMVFLLDLLIICSVLSLFSKMIADFFALFCLPIFITFLVKISYEDLFNK